jgi:hypothetical protein
MSPTPSPSGSGADCQGLQQTVKLGGFDTRIYSLPYTFGATYKYTSSLPNWSEIYNPICIANIGTTDVQSFWSGICGTSQDSFKTCYLSRGKSAIFQFSSLVAGVGINFSGSQTGNSGTSFQVKITAYLGSTSNPPIPTNFGISGNPICGIFYDGTYGIFTIPATATAIYAACQVGTPGTGTRIFDYLKVEFIGDSATGLTMSIAESIIYENPKSINAFNLSKNIIAEDPFISFPPKIVAEGANVNLVPVSRERAKLCKYAGKTPLEMVKKDCGACAVRSCEKFGLCSHSGVVDGRDDIYCCQLCDEYSNESAKLESKNISAAPKSESVTSETKMSSQSVNSVVQAPSQAQQIPNIPDSFSAADTHMAKSNMVKISPANLSIRVNINELVEGKDDQGAKG